jgi:hypothetical protein
VVTGTADLSLECNSAPFWHFSFLFLNAIMIAGGVIPTCTAEGHWESAAEVFQHTLLKRD